MTKKNQGSQILFYIIGFCLIFFAFTGSSIYFYQQFAGLRDTLVQTTKNNDTQLRAAMAMRVAVRERAILLWHMTLSEDFFERDELFERFYNHGSNYQKSRLALLSSELDSTEREIFTTLDSETTQRAPVLRRFADLLMEDVERDYTPELNRVLSDQIIVADQLDSLIDHQQQQNIAVREASALNLQILLKDLIVTLIAIVFCGLLFASIVIFNTRKQSMKLATANQRLEHIACHDTLTGLPNRLFLMNQLEVAIASSKRKKEHTAVLFIDLDNFKPVNDDYGHDIGDQCLKQVSEAMSKALRGSDILGRLAGDEFLVILTDIAAASHATVVANKLIHTLNETYSVGPYQFSFTASIGIYIHNEEDISAEECINLADKAMYQAKKAGKNQFFTI